MPGPVVTPPIVVTPAMLSLAVLPPSKLVEGLNALQAAGKTVIVDQAIATVGKAIRSSVMPADEIIIAIGIHTQNPTAETRAHALSVIARRPQAVHAAIQSSLGDIAFTDPAAIIEAGGLAAVNAEKAARLDDFAHTLNEALTRGPNGLRITIDASPAAPAAQATPVAPQTYSVLHRLTEGEAIPREGIPFLVTSRFAFQLGGDDGAPAELLLSGEGGKRIRTTDDEWHTSGVFHYNIYIRDLERGTHLGMIQVHAVNKQTLSSDAFTFDVLNPLQGAVEISYRTHSSYLRTGIMSEALGALMEYLKDAAGTTLFIANTDHLNAPSRKLLARLGFQLLHDRGEFGLYTLGTVPAQR